MTFVQDHAEKILEDEARRYLELKQHFGPEHIPRQKQYLIQVPLTPDILNRIYDNKPPIKTDAVWSLTTTLYIGLDLSLFFIYQFAIV